jgi:phosphonate transport system substrate-binding protein
VIVKIHSRAVLSAVLVGGLVLLGACGSNGKKGQAGAVDQKSTTTVPAIGNLRMGVIAIGTADDVKKQYDHTAADLGRALGGANVQVVTSTDYFAIIEGLRTKQLDFAFLGSLSYVLGKDVAGLEPLAVGVDANGQAGYYSLLITKNPKIKGPADLKGHSLALAGKTSTSGYLFGVDALNKAGLKLTDMKVSQGGNHAANILAVKQGAADAAFVDSTEYASAIKRGAIGPDELKVVWKSDRITGSPVAVRTDLPDSTRSALKQALLGLQGTDEFPLGLEKTKTMAAANDADYDPIRALAAQNGLTIDNFKPATTTTTVKK